MPAALLASQLETLEEPGAGESAIRVDAKISAAEVVTAVLEGLAAQR
jgi:gluconate kinase